MILTSSEYETIMAQEAPTDFDLCEGMAEEVVHAHTLYAYVGRTVSELPTEIGGRLKRCVAYQTKAVHDAGGAGAIGMSEGGTVSLGSFSYSGGGASSGSAASALCDGAAMIMPVLVAYGRELRAREADT